MLVLPLSLDLLSSHSAAPLKRTHRAAGTDRGAQITLTQLAADSTGAERALPA
jgi:hypothetical protein